MASERKYGLIDKMECPACGSDHIRGIDPADFFDGESAECGSCGAWMQTVIYTDNSFCMVLDEPEDDCADEEPNPGEQAVS